ncbi:MAG: fumarate hydrolyase [Chloroflexi bacterium]|nr:MAG: fumarate hydrolyase [Chloroflexota bacterium]
MADVALRTPLSESDVRQLAIGDSVTLSGIVFGVRDSTLMRVFDQQIAPPVDWHGTALLYVAPSVRKVGERYQALSVGTTTSMRMDRFTEGLLRTYGVRALLGKGGLSEESARRIAEHGAVYLSVTGGAAASQTLQLQEIEAVYWEDLMPECIWQFRFEGLGPLMVGIDALGHNLQMDVQQQARERLEAINRRLGLT